MRIVGVSLLPGLLIRRRVTNPTGGLFARCLPLCAYCSMGFFLELLAAFFAFAIESRSCFKPFRFWLRKFYRSYANRRRLSKARGYIP